LALKHIQKAAYVSDLSEKLDDNYVNSAYVSALSERLDANYVSYASARLLQSY